MGDCGGRNGEGRGSAGGWGGVRVQVQEDCQRDGKERRLSPVCRFRGRGIYNTVAARSSMEESIVPQLKARLVFLVFLATITISKRSD